MENGIDNAIREVLRVKYHETVQNGTVYLIVYLVRYQVPKGTLLIQLNSLRSLARSSVFAGGVTSATGAFGISMGMF